MTIQINTDKNLSVHETFRAQLDDLLPEELDRLVSILPGWKFTCQMRMAQRKDRMIKDACSKLGLKGSNL